MQQERVEYDVYFKGSQFSKTNPVYFFPSSKEWVILNYTNLSSPPKSIFLTGYFTKEGNKIVNKEVLIIINRKGK